MCLNAERRNSAFFAWQTLGYFSPRSSCPSIRAFKNAGTWNPEQKEREIHPIKSMGKKRWMMEELMHQLIGPWQNSDILLGP